MKDESGFTIMETLCAIALLVILAGISGTVIFNTRRITENIQTRADINFMQMRIETIIREVAEEIVLPYWEKDERALPLARVAITNELLKAGYEIDVEIEALHDNIGRVRGVHCRYHIEDLSFESSGLFASIPLEGDLK